MCEVMEKYMAEAKLQQLIDLVREGLLKLADAAQKAGMTEEEFKKLL